MSWKLQKLLWKFLPADRDVNISVWIFGIVLLLALIAFFLGYRTRRRWVCRMALVLAAMTLLFCGFLFASRPAWLRVAMRPVVPMPTIFSSQDWRMRSAGLETAEWELRIEGVAVDQMMLVRLDPQLYRISIHHDPSGTRTAADWQRELGATVVTNASYFGDEFAPLTPLRCSGVPSGPMTYVSSHGAFVADESRVEILDLKNRDVFEAIGKYPQAVVSYPLLIDAEGSNRALENKNWLASRNFIAIDELGRVVLGTTKTGFFTIHRLGEFLKASPLRLRLALNFDGGPLVSQVVRAGDFLRDFHGEAEISNSADVLRIFWHTSFRKSWTIPIVLAVEPRNR